MLQQGAGQGQPVAELLGLLIGPLGEWLDERLERRLVRALFLTLVAMARRRHSRSGLLRSELGAHIISPDRAPAGTKRRSNRLRAPQWSPDLREGLLWHRAELSRTQLREQAERALAIWDESVLEKPESIAWAGLCPVRSSKAARLKRIKPGYYNPPGGRPVFVPGLQGRTLMVAGMPGLPALAAMRWWTSLAADRGERPAGQITRGKGSQAHSARSGTATAGSIAKPASWPSQCDIPNWMMVYGWRSPVRAKDASLGPC